MAVQGLDFACHKGCAACCTYAVEVTMDEAALMAAAVQIHPDRQKIIGQLHAWERAWTSHEAIVRDMFAASKRWQVKRIACPLLDVKTHECTVYETRPMNCRSHHACQPPVWMEPYCTICPTRPAGDGCFTTPEDVRHDHFPVVQLDAELGVRSQHMLIARLGGSVNMTPTMPLAVLKCGRDRYGWRPPAKLPAPYVMRRSEPPGSRRG
jgi:Fe-S-cluster containining protein